VDGWILFPNTVSQRATLLETYEQLGPVLLPHLAGWPLTVTVKRFPEDIHNESFWEKRPRASHTQMGKEARGTAQA